MFGAENRGSADFAIRWTTNVDCDNAWKHGKIDEFDTLAGADEGDREEVRCAAFHGFLEITT